MLGGASHGPSTAHPARILAVLVALAAGGAATLAHEELPLRLGIEVRYGPQGGPTKLREDLGRLLIDSLLPSGWFRDVALLEPNDGEPPDLVLRVTLDNLREETVYETSMDEQIQHDDPLTRMRYGARFQADVVIELALLPGRELVRSRRMREYVSRPARFAGEDTAAGVRAEALADLALAVRKSILKGSPDKLRRRIAKVRAQQPRERPR